jgi:hypothetical protein
VISWLSRSICCPDAVTTGEIEMDQPRFGACCNPSLGKRRTLALQPICLFHGLNLALASGGMKPSVTGCLRNAQVMPAGLAHRWPNSEIVRSFGSGQMADADDPHAMSAMGRSGHSNSRSYDLEARASTKKGARPFQIAPPPKQPRCKLSYLKRAASPTTVA